MHEISYAHIRTHQCDKISHGRWHNKLSVQSDEVRVQQI